MSIWKKTITRTDEGKKLETFLIENGFTKKEISRLKFKNPGMRVNNQPARSTTLLHSGQIVEVFLADQNFHAEYLNPNPLPKHLEIHPDIQYEDNNLLVINKPSGLSCHPGKGHYHENLGSILTSYCINKGISCPIREIGRLDKDTSGLVVFAKSRDTAARLWKQKENGLFRKTYTVLVHGTIKESSGKITFDMESVPDKKNRMRICKTGMTAITNYKLLNNLSINEKPYSLLECQIETGRTHQIRVHMAALGHPVVGDTFYGIDIPDKNNPDDTLPNTSQKRLCLHAGEILFFQPYTQEKIHIETPVNFIPFT